MNNQMTMTEQVEASRDAKPEIPSFPVLGVRVHAVQITDIIRIVEQWVRQRGAAQYIAVTGMHGISEAQEDSHFRDILQSAGLVIPDGMPLVWLGRFQGHRAMIRRTPGSEVMEEFCRATGSKYRHFFYGGVPGVADLLAKSERERYGIRIAGTYCPPFRPLTQEEEREVQAMIRDAAPDILWVGLSTPKQEKWMYDHRQTIQVPVMLGVGAAFDMNTGRLKRAPKWMQETGLEWLYRLLMEPRRLWRRYIINGSKFVWAVWKEHLIPQMFRRPEAGSAQLPE
jgi:N-acetylglucosaminyldiphosphoundecaprenol N-acetyl-beta-D-mannosaminyltransferase